MADKPQALGSLATISMIEQDQAEVIPAAPVVYGIGVATSSGITLKATVEKVDSAAKAYGGQRGQTAGRAGNVDVAGQIPFELAIEGVGRLLKHALGKAVTYRAARLLTEHPRLRVLWADMTTPVGDGAVDITATALKWTPAGGGAGAAVTVSKPGRYRLPAGAAGQELVVEVTGSDPLPAGNVAVSVSADLRTHRLTRGPLPVGFAVQLNYANIGIVEVYRDCRIDKLSLKVGTSGNVTGSLDLVGRSVVRPGAAYGPLVLAKHQPVLHSDALLTESGSPATFTDFSMDLGNELDKVRVVGRREVANTPEGRGTLQTSATYLFVDRSISDRVLQEQVFDQRMRFTLGEGAMEIYLPRCQAFGDVGVGIQTDKGLVQQLTVTPSIDPVLQTDIEILITNRELSL